MNTTAYAGIAFRRLHPPTTDVGTVHHSLGAYLDRVTRHCTALVDVLGDGFLRWWSCESGPRYGRYVFELLVEAAEDVRQRRGRSGVLACAGVAVFGPPSAEDADELLCVPVAVAQGLYAGAGLMFGAFVRDRAQADQHGRRLPGPAVSFVVVRPAVFPADIALLERGGDDFVLPAAHDDGRDVFRDVLGGRARVRDAARHYPRVVAHLAAQEAVRREGVMT
ncbi:hypothetical protein [Catellatospora sp. NPDC049609]|uniref:hypothetical protein n=1 Tax=Catellatospora sp. NPDC049609 TaxID=3155505 RepID=UPI00342D0426